MTAITFHDPFVGLRPGTSRPAGHPDHLPYRDPDTDCIHLDRAPCTLEEIRAFRTAVGLDTAKSPSAETPPAMTATSRPLTKTLSIEVYADPGHSWAKVDTRRLEKLLGPGWRNHFTPYSYEHKCFAFLEEDEDCARLDAALRYHGIEPTFRLKHQAEKESRIRNYPSLATRWQHGDPRPQPSASYSL